MFLLRNKKDISSFRMKKSALAVAVLWYSLEVPLWGASNEYHNICLHGEIRKYQQFSFFFFFFFLKQKEKKCLTWSDEICLC